MNNLMIHVTIAQIRAMSSSDILAVLPKIPGPCGPAPSASVCKMAAMTLQGERQTLRDPHTLHLSAAAISGKTLEEPAYVLQLGLVEVA